ncbi:alpha/beta fold hydrolase [Methyloterricola oryzae]|uniref:alpha/beta fold hydrolase n=1 Tax=Methyloterricola oryzae TaxID=1495050 RepID=UPI0013013A58|nr:alpha/beta hydrolase [Methyloterricola oryzae]
MHRDWVFLRGLARESAHWADFPETFTAKVRESRIFLADLPGNGRHFASRSPSSITSMMELIRHSSLSALPATGGSSVEAPRYLLAISLGAMVAVEWMSRYPEEIAGAVLINTSLRGINPIHQRLQWRAWPELARIVLTHDPVLREQRILQLTSRERSQDSALALAFASAFRLRPMRRINLMRQLWAAATYQAPPSPPLAPVLLLSSHADQMVSPACSAAIANAWHAPLACHPWAGHDLPLDDPDWVADRVNTWLSQSPSVCNQVVTDR